MTVTVVGDAVETFVAELTVTVEVLGTISVGAMPTTAGKCCSRSRYGIRSDRLVGDA